MKRINLIIGAGVVILLCAISSIAQLQQSGGPGSTVTVGAALPAGANVVGKLGIDQTTPGTTNAVQFTNASIGITGALPAGTNVIGHVITDSGTITAVTAISNALPTGANVIGSVVTIPKTACGNTAYDSNPTFLPTSATAVTATTTCVMGIYLTNVDAAAHTLTVSDGSTQCGAGVCTYVGPAFSIPALSNMNIPLEGMKFTTGVKWNVTDASSNKVIGQVYGFQ